MRARRVGALVLVVVLALAASVVWSARLDLDDDDDSDVLDELLAIDEEAERGELDGGGSGGDGGATEAVRRTQSMVLALDNDNARRAVEDHAELLLLGYAPWCERSAQLMPRFAEAAAALRAMGSAVTFAKLDGERYPKAAASVGVKGFPTVLLFVNGTEHAYHGLHTK
jgi:protein disulfide-isomerase A1